MKAVVFTEHGPPEVLKVVDLETPEPGAGQVRVRVRASGVQPFDTGIRAGWPGFPVSFPQQIGNEFAGVVDACGPDIPDIGIRGGDEVLGWTFMNALAEYVVVDLTSLALKPTEVPWAVAGALSASGQTAVTALDALGVSSGDALLVHAAAGGVGTVAVQLAQLRGASVVGTAGPDNHGYLTELGVVPVSYTGDLVANVRAARPEPFDAVLDGAGGEALTASLELVDDPKQIVTLVEHDEAERIGARGIRAERSADRLAELAALCADGSLRVHVRATFGLDDVVAAHHEVERGHGRGKVVIEL